MKNPEPIAERVIYAVDKDGRGFDIGLQIGTPYQTDSPHGDWACPVAMIGLHRQSDIRGVDSWQALNLALRLPRSLLFWFVEGGGNLFWERDGEPLNIDELFGESPPQPLTPDEPLILEEQERVDQLSDDELATIDAAILRNCSEQFRKIARVVGTVMIELNATIPSVPETFYADRVRHLVAEGKLESQGRIDAMRFGEVKLR